MNAKEARALSDKIAEAQAAKDKEKAEKAAAARKVSDIARHKKWQTEFENDVAPNVRYHQFLDERQVKRQESVPLGRTSIITGEGMAKAQRRLRAHRRHNVTNRWRTCTVRGQQNSGERQPHRTVHVRQRHARR